MEHLFTSWLLHYGLIGIFLMLAIEDMGVPLPTQFAYLGAQTLISTGSASFLATLATLQGGFLAGSLISYFIGRRLAYPLSKGKASHAQQKLSEWYGRYGLPTVFFVRLIGYVRPWSSYAAGIAEVPFLGFIVFNFLGSLALNLIVLGITHEGAGLWNRYPIIQQGFGVLVGLGFLVTGLAYLSQRRKLRLDSKVPTT